MRGRARARTAEELFAVLYGEDVPSIPVTPCDDLVGPIEPDPADLVTPRTQPYIDEARRQNCAGCLDRPDTHCAGCGQPARYVRQVDQYHTISLCERCESVSRGVEEPEDAIHRVRWDAMRKEMGKEASESLNPQEGKQDEYRKTDEVKR